VPARLAPCLPGCPPPTFCLCLNPASANPQLHGGNIVDMAWTPDGYTLITASADDKVSVLR